MKKETESERARQTAARLKRLRIAFDGDDWGSQRRFAMRVGIPTNTWNNYEAGVGPPRRDIAERLYKVGVDLDWIYDGRMDGVSMRTAELLRQADDRPTDGGTSPSRHDGKRKAKRA